MLKAGRPSTKKKTAKEKAIEGVQEPDKNDTVRFNVDIPKELHKRIKIRAAEEDLKLNQLTIKLFTDYLSKQVNE